MKSCGLQSSILTQLCMRKQNLITKEKSKAAYEGKLKNEDHWNFWNCYDGSINDDMESFINNLQEISSLEEIKKEEVHSFFLPKLRKEELKLVEEKNFEHMMTYWRKFNADVDKEEMKKSDSKDKYVHGKCIRTTSVLHLDSNLCGTSTKMSSESPFTITNESSNETSDGTYVKLKIADELKQLANMGFRNEKLNIHLIQKHCQVNLQAVIEELKAYQTSSCSRITVESSNATSAVEPTSQQVSNHAETSIETVSESLWHEDHGSDIPYSIQSRPGSPCIEAVTESEFLIETPDEEKECCCCTVS